MVWRCALAVLAALLSGQVLAADLSKPSVIAPPAAPWNWNGGYAGIHAGGMLGFSEVSDPYGASVFGDRMRTPAFLLGGQAGYNWQPAGSNWVFGIEGDVSWLDAATVVAKPAGVVVKVAGVASVASAKCR